MGKLQRALTLFLMAGFGLILSGCGGEDAFSTPPEGGTDPGASSVSNVILLTSTPTLGSASNSEVDLTAQVKDTNNALLEGQTVIFSATGGGLEIVSNTTDAAGMATAKLSSAGDPTNRAITVTATAGTRSASVAIDVTGTGVTVSGESSVVLGDSTELTIFLKDSAGNGIPNKTVTVSSDNGNTLDESTLTTGLSGSAQVLMRGTVVGMDTIAASALGATANFSVEVSPDQFSLSLPSADMPINQDHTITVNWSQAGNPVNGQTVNFSTTRGTLSSPTATTSGGQATANISSSGAGPVKVTASVAGGPSASATAEFVATTPASMTLQADAATIGPNGQEDKITAVVRDSNNNLVKSIPIRFTVTQDNSNGSISNPTDTTDNLGRASTIYTSTDVTTAKDGVVIQAEVENRASYEGGIIPCASSNLCTTVAITVAQADLFVRLGTGNLLEPYSSTLYKKPYTVVITDSAGNARPNVEVKIALIPTWYAKGRYYLGAGEDGFFNTADDEAPWRKLTGTPDLMEECRSEDNLNPDPDTKFNGIIDLLEDINENGQLEPGNVAVVPGTVVTDEDGIANFDITYAKNFATWTRVKLTASTQVAGSEGSDEVEFWLAVLAADLTNKDTLPPGYRSPFGEVLDCTEAD